MTQPMWINGAPSQAHSSETIEVINPATEEVVAEVPRGDAEDARAAIEAADRAYRLWRRLTVADRAPLIHRIATFTRAHRDELAHLLTLEQGKPVRDNVDELNLAADTFDFYAELARSESGRMIPAGDPDQLDFVIKEPYGVTACIVPWNFPIQLMAWKVAPALGAGNTVVIKPSSLTPLTTLRWAELATSHLPPGVVNVVAGTGGEIGEAMARHPAVRHIALTGSLATGRQVAAEAAGMMKKVSLELGGKDPLVIAPDADTATAVRALAFAGLLNAGQCCTSTERVYVPESQFASFADALVSHVSGYRLGSGLEPDTDMGPMISALARDKVEAQLEEAVAAGGRVLVGGKRPAGLDRGFFYEPTVIVDVDHSMRLLREETFGPVLPLIRYRSFDEAIALANDTEYGLAASLLTHDASLVKRFMEGVEAGTIYINDPLTPNCAAPFGGMKQSGMGRELGAEGLDEFRQVKHVHWDVVGAIKPSWR